MKLVRYPFKHYTEKYYYQFYSTGPNGTVRKLVCFELYLNSPFQTFNLAFGDAKENSDEINDKAVTNNSDSLKVLFTVALITLEFLRYRPGVWITAEGSSPARNRLYRMWIGRYWNEINQYFDVYGQQDGYWQPFETEILYDRFIHL